MLRSIRSVLIAAVISSIGGCGTTAWSSRSTNPVIEDHTGIFIKNLFTDSIVSTFSTTASRRIVIVKEYEDAKGTKRISSCAEPSPDVGEAFSSAIADGIRIAAEAKGVTPELSNQYAKAVSTQITPLVYRTQGLQLYRDAMYSLCIDRLNEWTKGEDDKDLIDKTQSYESLRHYYFKEAAVLIAAEFKTMQAAQKAFAESAKAGDTKLNVEDVTKLLNATKPSNTSGTAK